MCYKIEINKTKYNHLKDSYILSNPEELFKNKYNNYNLVINKLELLNPLNILSKGYSVVSNNDKIIKRSKDVNVGDKIRVRLSEGIIDASVERID